MIAQKECLEKCTQMQILIYYMNSVTAEELIAFIKVFFSKYDKSSIYMLNFKQFTAMMESMARKFSADTMEKYFLMMDKFKYHENCQKDKMLELKKDPDLYFGPFVMECVFNRFKGDKPVITSLSGGEYMTDFWKFLPFVFNMMMLEDFKTIESIRRKFYVALFDA